MNDWMAHLKALGGHLDDHHRWQFAGETPATAGPALVALSHFKILECQGPDAERFLQGQTSANLAHANGDYAPLTAFCTPKGRMIANGELLKVDDERYWLLLDVSLAEPLAQQLGKYAPFYKMTLTRRDDIVLFGVIGTPATLADRALPQSPWHMRVDDGVWLRHPGPRPRWIVALEAEAAIAEWHRIAGGESTTDAVEIKDSATWQQADVLAGVGWLTATHSDSLLPQMINWEALGGISFRKGCYTGQEVVARAHFRGQVKRRLGIVSLPAGLTPAVGSDIRDADDKRVGELFSAVETDGRHVALVVLSTALEPEATLTLDGQPVTREPLPYPLERLDPESAISA